MLPFSDDVRNILHQHFDAEFEKRFIGMKPAIERIPLDCMGPWHQQHCDGHEKLSHLALGMGDVSLPIYGFKDQYSAFVPLLVVLPNVRLAIIIAHLYLDYVELHGCKCANFPLYSCLTYAADIQVFHFNLLQIRDRNWVT
jgi:hypothetical protein